MYLYYPLSRNKGITLMLVVISAALIVGQMILTDANPFILWCNWLVAGALAVSLWYIMGRFHLGGAFEGKALAITWPLMSMTLNFAYLYFDISYPYYRGLIQLFALMGIITLSLSIWQETQSTWRNLCIGMLIGLSSTFFPHTILWLFMIPFIMFHMRATSSRNVFSILTGALLGIWIDYCLLFFQSTEVADAMLLHYLDIVQVNHYVETFDALSLWQWLYLSITAILLFIYSLSTMLLGTGHSVRSNASIMLLSGLSIAAIAFLCIDHMHTTLYICQLSLFLSIQLSIQQTNIKSSANEWWTLFILALCVTISILPLI